MMEKLAEKISRSRVDGYLRARDGKIVNGRGAGHKWNEMADKLATGALKGDK